jgi:radical SAM protein with 4Fe4S-binding SPASM domain
LTEWIDEAFMALAEVDAVFAPAEDGGYNLVGLKQTYDLFSGISMSTPHVLADTLERARALGLSVHLLPTSFDVDEIEDLEKLRRFLAQNGESLPHTQNILKQTGEPASWGTVRMPTKREQTFSLGLGLTNDCNLACAHCYRETLRIDRLSLEEVKAACESLPIRSVNLGTGENALHPQFQEILRYLQSKDIKLTITSNGYSASALSDSLLRYFDAIEFSLDFPTEAEQDAFRGPGNWRLIMEQIERCHRLDIPVTITAVMMRINYDKVADVARLAAALGATFRVNVYQSVKTDAFALSYDQFWTGFKKLFAVSRLLVCNEPIVRAVLGMKESRRGGCGQTTVRVSPGGEVLPCVYWPEEPLRLSDLVQQGKQIVDTELFRRLATVPEFCRSCEFVETCGGGCAGRRRLRGKLDEPDEFCPFVRGETIDLSCERASGQEFPKAASACTIIVEGKASEMSV